MTSPQDTSSQPGAKVVIPCQAVGDPEPVISWMFNEKEINLDSSEDSDTVDSQHHHQFTQLPSGALRIESFGHENAGDYRCKATNMMGDAMSRPARMTMEDRSFGGTDQGTSSSAAAVSTSATTASTSHPFTAGDSGHLEIDHVPEDVTIPLNDSIILHCAEKGTSRTDWRATETWGGKSDYG